ncbi:Adenylate kinase 7 [Eumeta japonica]|uniref:Adenylate kinase 7 n=1 Tax=Eumeta variegata TaxID=151549 RepID=A0A4C1VYP8_EUMVA|nr:Adenylate kinase 7 [Eumeta japonica]
MTVDLNMEPTFIAETMGLQWVSELTFAENLPVLMKDFKKERGLKPFRVLVYGPPLVGKTTLSKRICEKYGLIYISYDTIVQDTIDDLAWRVRHWETGELSALPQTGEEEETEEDGNDGEDETVRETARQTLAWLTSGAPVPDEDIQGRQLTAKLAERPPIKNGETKSANSRCNGLSNESVRIPRYLRQRLLKNDALNRGWVIDGYPATLDQCAALFGKGEEPDSEPEEVEPEEEGYFEEDANLYEGVLRKILPTLVVTLEATDEFIIHKAVREPDSPDVRMDEEHFLGRLSRFRAGDTRLITPLNFFDERGIHPLVIPVTEYDDYAMQNAYSEVSLRMGRPCRYGKLKAAIEVAEKSEKKMLDALKRQEENALRELEKKIIQEREDKMEYWSELYGLMREEEEQALAAAAEPLRDYLVKYIFPALTPALLQVAETRPEDPVDYLKGIRGTGPGPSVRWGPGTPSSSFNLHVKSHFNSIQVLFVFPKGSQTLHPKSAVLRVQRLCVPMGPNPTCPRAEYLFKKNPTGKMLEPGYNLQAERLLGKIKILDDALLDLDINIDPLAPPEALIGEVTPSDEELMGCNDKKTQR